MNQSNSYIIAVSLISASVYTMLTCHKSQPFVDYENSLNNQQQILYNESIKERSNLYIQGLLIGIILAIFYLYLNADSPKRLYHSGVATTIIFVVQFLYYMLMPKRVYMLKHLNTRRQINGWLDVYLRMKNRYYIGMLLGIIGFVLLSNTILSSSVNLVE